MLLLSEILQWLPLISFRLLFRVYVKVNSMNFMSNIEELQKKKTQNESYNNYTTSSDPICNCRCSV